MILLVANPRGGSDKRGIFYTIKYVYVTIYITGVILR